MPHQCTECGRAFPDGSKEMLSGCPDCGGNKFQFKPAGSEDELDDAGDGDASPDPPSRGGVADRVGRATATVKRWVSGGDDGVPNGDGAASEPSAAATDRGADPDPSTTGSDPSPTAADSPAVGGGPSDGGAASSSGAEATAAENDDGRAYGEWPNPDGADTGGVGKGPDARRTRSSSDDDAGGEWPDAADHTDRRTEDGPDAADHTDRRTEDGDEGRPDDPEESQGDADELATTDVDEDTAQASARSDVVSRDELPKSPPDSGTLGPRQPIGSDGPVRDESGVASRDVGSERASAGGGEGSSAGGTTTTTKSGEAPPETADGRVASEPSADDRPDLDDLREELNDQFESIKIVEPGQYELNLMELYDREEYIISLQEDGRYVIEVPERWRDED